MLFRFLLITGIIFYLLYKIGSFFFRAGAAAQQLRDLDRKNINNNNNDPSPRSKRGTKKSGEYIDYEEVK